MSVTPLGRENEAIQEMLLDAGLEGASDLRSALEELRTHSLKAAPEPRAELAALLDAGVPSIAQDAPSLVQRRWSRRRRMAVVGAALAGAMSLGAGAVAASNDDFRRSVSEISLTVGRIFLPPDEAPGQQQDQEAPPPASVPAVQVPAATPPAPETTAAQEATQAPAAPGTSAPSPAATAQGGDHAAVPYEPPAQLPDVPGGSAVKELPTSPLPGVPTLPRAVPTQLGQ